MQYLTFHITGFINKCIVLLRALVQPKYTVCPGSSDPPEKILNIFTSENEVYAIFSLLRYFRLNIIRLQSKII